MKKVLFVATVVKTHINVFHLPFLKLFQKNGYKTYVAAANDMRPDQINIPYCDEYVEIDFKRNPLKFKNISAFFNLKKLIKDNDFDIIHCHTPVGGLLGRLASLGAKRKNIKVIYTAHGFHFYKGAPIMNWFFYFPVEWICSFITDVLITINKEDYEFAKKHLHPKKLEYVSGVGINIEKFNDIAVNRSDKRAELGIGEDSIIILSVGELINRKNHKTVITAIKELNNEKIHYAIVGDGVKRLELQALAEKLGILDKIYFLGFRKDVAEIYKVADFFCFPSIQEGLPVSLMEAMASGLPCIVSKVRGNTDLIDSNGGITFNPFSVDDCKLAILKILSSDTESMREYNYKKIEKFGLKSVLAQMERIYFENAK